MRDLVGRVALIIPERDFDIDRIVRVEHQAMSVEQQVEVAKEWAGPEFSERVRAGDFILGARNFGFGHPHYPTMNAMRKMGIAAVMAESFSPYYLIGEIAKGFPGFTCPGILELCDLWDEIEVRWADRTVHNRSKGKSIAFEPISPSDMSILEAGGLLPHLINQYAQSAKV